MNRATRGDGLRPATGQCQAMRSCRQIPVTRAEAIGGRKETNGANRLSAQFQALTDRWARPLLR